MATPNIKCSIKMSQPKECSIPENDLSPRSDPYIYIKINLRLRTYLRLELTSTAHYEHTTFELSSIYPFIRWWYPELHYDPVTVHSFICQIEDGMDRISRDPRNAGAAILPMEVWLSLDEFKDDTTEPMCVICHENLYPNFLTMLTPCYHLFHVSCIDEWLERSVTCPICRSDLSLLVDHSEDTAYYSHSEDDDLD